MKFTNSYNKRTPLIKRISVSLVCMVNAITSILCCLKKNNLLKAIPVSGKVIFSHCSYSNDKAMNVVFRLNVLAFSHVYAIISGLRISENGFCVILGKSTKMQYSFMILMILTCLWNKRMKKHHGYTRKKHVLKWFKITNQTIRFATKWLKIYTYHPHKSHRNSFSKFLNSSLHVILE